MDTDANRPMETGHRKVHFLSRKGVEVAESLAFGRMKATKHFSMHDNLSPVLLAGCRFIMDVIVWEEALLFVAIVKALTTDVMDEEVDPLLQAGKSILKPFHRSSIPYDVVGYDPDPDNRDRNKFRFPDLRTYMRRGGGVGRTASPPPRPDKSNHLWEEAARRLRNERFRGPPLPWSGCPKMKGYIRAKEWEMELPEDDHQADVLKRKRNPELELVPVNEAKAMKSERRL